MDTLLAIQAGSDKTFHVGTIAGRVSEILDVDGDELEAGAREERAAVGDARGGRRVRQHGPRRAAAARQGHHQCW